MGAETSKADAMDDSSVHAALSQRSSSEKEKLREISRQDKIVRNRVRGGVHYNMKIILCGERGSGKTALFKRFQGLSFVASHTPTPEIQGATINWDYKSNEDTAKVEVWDVVDRALRSSRPQAMAAGSTTGADGAHYGHNKALLLDATVVDIYKGTHAVLYMLNPASPSSLQYVREKYKEVPLDIPILLVLNFKDKIVEATSPAASQARDHDVSGFSSLPDYAVRFGLKEVEQLCAEIRIHRKATTLSAATVSTASHARTSTATSSAAIATAAAAPEIIVERAETLPCSTGVTTNNTAGRSNELFAAGLMDDDYFDVHFCESSMKNCFGLLHIHKYLDVPFLKLKQQVLRDQLRTAERDLREANMESDDVIGTLDYDDYVAQYQARARARRMRTAAAGGASKTEAARAAQAAAAAATAAAEDNIRSSLRTAQERQEEEDADKLKASIAKTKEQGHGQGQSKKSAASANGNAARVRGANGTAAATVPRQQASGGLKLSHHVHDPATASSSSVERHDQHSPSSPSTHRNTNNSNNNDNSNHDLNHHHHSTSSTADSFKPSNGQASGAQLEAFLAPSDEDEKKLVSKRHIRSFARTDGRNIQTETNGTPVATAGNSGGGDGSGRSTHSGVKIRQSLKQGAGSGSHSGYGTDSDSGNDGSSHGVSKARTRPVGRSLRKPGVAAAAGAASLSSHGVLSPFGSPTSGAGAERAGADATAIMAATALMRSQHPQQDDYDDDSNHGSGRGTVNIPYEVDL